jgi:thioredoxin 1
MAPVLDELAYDYAGRVKFAVLSVDENHAVASQYGVRGVPALYFYRRGKVMDQTAGAVPKEEVVSRLQSLLTQG